MEYLSFKTNLSKAKEIQDYYHASETHNPSNPYDFFQVETSEGVFIKAYRSKNEQYTIVFSGFEDKVLEEAGVFFKSPSFASSTSVLRGWEDVNTQIGSDEVGVGDFFLGFYICACYLTKADVDFIDSLNVMDSKKLTDSRMEDIGPLLMKRIKHHVVRISPDKLCFYEDKKWSTHMILAKAHNLTHANLIKAYHIKDDVPVYIDQFEKEKIYRHYVGSQIVTNPLIFRTKGESHFPSVATASVIARYCFLTDWKKMENTLGMTIPKGASALVDKTYVELVKKHGKEAIDPYVKRFFKNYTK